MITKGQLILSEQECEGNYDFLGVRPFMTRGFKTIFGENSLDIAIAALLAISERYNDNADYLQVFNYIQDGDSTKFYCIHSETYITFLLPEEY